MKGIVGFIVWIIIGVICGAVFDFHGVVDIMLFPICVIYRIYQWLIGEDWRK